MNDAHDRSDRSEGRGREDRHEGHGRDSRPDGHGRDRRNEGHGRDERHEGRDSDDRNRRTTGGGRVERGGRSDRGDRRGSDDRQGSGDRDERHRPRGEGGRSRADRRDFRASTTRHRSAAAPSARARHVDTPRRVAYDVMRAISQGAYANLELPKRLRAARLHGRDAAFVTELVYGASRLRGRYDPIVARGAGRELSQIDADVLDVLRLGAHQLLGMRVDAYAAVDASVALAREVLGTGRAGFVNAVLRRVSEKDEAAWLDILTRDLEPGSAAELAVTQSHPEWVVRALQGALVGHDDDPASGAQIGALLAADNEPAAVSLVARPGLADREELIDAGAEPSTTSPIGAVLRSGGDPGDISAVREGRAAVQDEGSQVVTLAALAAAAELVGTAPGQRWLDLCAGPGGKAALLAAASIEADATVFANDASEHRTRLVDQAVGAALDAGADVYVGTGDGREIGAEEPESFDLVLLDAPCTGLGALRRRPEARWRREPDDVGALSRLQGQLLDSAVAATRPGGLIAYVTCSPHLAETRYVVADALARHPELEQLDARPYVRDAAGEPLTDTGAGPSVQLWPHRHGTDAMFLAFLRRGPGD